MKRKWTDMQKLEPVILQMREDGRTRQEIADALGLKKKQITNWVTRYNHRQERIPIVRKKGRPRKRPVSDPEAMELRIRELERAVELYRSFLQAAGRM